MCSPPPPFLEVGVIYRTSFVRSLFFRHALSGKTSHRILKTGMNLKGKKLRVIWRDILGKVEYLRDINLEMQVNTRSQTKIKICKNNFRAFALRQGVCGLQKQSNQKLRDVSRGFYNIRERVPEVLGQKNCGVTVCERTQPFTKRTKI